MAEDEVQIVYLVTDAAGGLLHITDSEADAQGTPPPPGESIIEIVEWPVPPLESLGPDNAYQLISSDSAELGKLGSIDVLLQIELAVRAADGWEVVSILPGQFGQNVYPPSLTAVFRKRP